jgi:hypothetical protein
MRTAKKSTKSRPPGPGVRREEVAQSGSPAELTARLHGVAARANAGDRTALAELRRMLDAHPEIWRHVGDLSALAERAWIELITGADNLTVESLKRQVARLKEELNGAHATPTERLLVDQVVVSWLAVNHAQMAAAQDGGSIEQAALRLRRADSAQRRYLGAMKLLTQLRALMPAGLAPLDAPKLHDPRRKRA